MNHRQERTKKSPFLISLVDNVEMNAGIHSDMPARLKHFPIAQVFVDLRRDGAVPGLLLESIHSGIVYPKDSEIGGRERGADDGYRLREKNLVSEMGFQVDR